MKGVLIIELSINTKVVWNRFSFLLHSKTLWCARHLIELCHWQLVSRVFTSFFFFSSSPSSADIGLFTLSGEIIAWNDNTQKIIQTNKTRHAMRKGEPSQNLYYLFSGPFPLQKGGDYVFVHRSWLIFV